MKRTIKKQVWLSREEAEMLKKKSKKACLSEAGLVRFLLRGYEPKEKPDDRFYEAMNEMAQMTASIEKLVRGEDNAALLAGEINRWHRFQADIEMKFLTPDETDLKWQ